MILRVAWAARCRKTARDPLTCQRIRQRTWLRAETAKHPGGGGPQDGERPPTCQPTCQPTWLRAETAKRPKAVAAWIRLATSPSRFRVERSSWMPKVTASIRMGSITMTGGDVTVNGPVNGGNGAIDFAGTFDISGGTLLAIGSSGMAECPAYGFGSGFPEHDASETVNSESEPRHGCGCGRRHCPQPSPRSRKSSRWSSPPRDVTSGTEYTVYQVEDGATDVSEWHRAGYGHGRRVHQRNV